MFNILQDVEKKGDDSDESEESDNDDEADKQMGETEEGAERLVFLPVLTATLAYSLV